MSSITRDFRKWWKPPHRTSEREEERTVTFLELFYDLVYVVVIAEISHGLAVHVGLQGFVEFALLFVVVWLAWLNGALYHDLHGNNDFRTRVFTFLQMFTVAAMAVFANNAFDAGSVGFALSFAAFQLIFAYLRWRTGVHDPLHRPLSRPYVFTFSSQRYPLLPRCLFYPRCDSISGALLMGVIQLDPKYLPLYRTGAMMTALSAALSFGLGFLPIGIIPLLFILVLLMLLPVFYGFKVWVVVFDAEEITIT